jgi:hypothetical protein
MGDLIELIGGGSCGTPPKPGLAIAVVKDFTGYGSPKYSTL